MSTPMFALPEHLKIGVTASGAGPVEPDEPGFHRWECWCGRWGCREYERDAS
jgi:hypothetical protein